MSAIVPFASRSDTELLQIIAGALVDPVTLEPIPIAGVVAFSAITGNPSDNSALDAALDAKAPLASPAFTGTAIIPAINGGSAANDDITIQGTSNGTRDTSYVILQPNGGNVGIGGNAPNAFLQITTNTGVNFQNAIRFDKAGGYGASGIQNYYTNGANYGLGFEVIGVTNVVINNLGNVGIGTTGPGSKLHVLSGTLSITGEHNDGVAIFEGPSVAGSAAILNVSSNTAFAANLGGSIGFAGLYRTATDPVMFGRILGAKENASEADYAGYLALFTTPNGGSATERLRITSAGNVGIGTTTPGAKLEISQTSGSATQLLLTNSAASTEDFQQIKFQFSQSDPTHGSAIRGIVQTGGGNGAALAFLTDNTSGALTERMRIDKNGIVAIPGSLTVGSGGTPIALIISATATLDFPSTAAGTSSDLTIALTGAAVGDTVAIGVPNGSVVADGSFSAWVSAADTVTVRFLNSNLVTASDPASGTFRASLIQF